MSDAEKAAAAAKAETLDFDPGRYREQLNVAKTTDLEGNDVWKLSKLEDPILAMDAASTAVENNDIYLRKLYEDTGIRVNDLINEGNTTQLAKELQNVYGSILERTMVITAMEPGTVRDAKLAEQERVAGEYRSAVVGAVGQGLNEHLTNSADILQDAIKDLTGAGWNFAEKLEDKEKFVKRYSGELDENVLNELFDLQMSEIANGRKPQDIFRYRDGGNMWEGEGTRTVNTLMTSPGFVDGIVNRLSGFVNN